MTDKNDIFYQLCLYRSNGVGPLKFANLIATHGDARAAAASLNLTQEFKDQISREMESAEKIGAFYICGADDDFPKNLKHSYGCAPVLCCLGNRETLRRSAVACVGTRHASSAGLNIMQDIAGRFAENDYAVVSGLAMGTDTAAHRGALMASGNANTIAVVAGGVDYVWPLENQKLYEEILSRGLVLSEMPVGTKPVAYQFAQRNRIIAALAEKLVLGESNEKSGSLITAGFAAEFGRRIYAIPTHPSDARGAGPNRLIREGRATLCCGADDFFPKLEMKPCVVNTKTADFGDDLDENSEILDLIGFTPLSESAIASATGKNIAIIKKKLIVLEMQNQIIRVAGGFVLNSN